MKIAVFTDDFEYISDRPSKAAGLAILQINEKREIISRNELNFNSKINPPGIKQNTENMPILKELLKGSDSVSISNVADFIKEIKYYNFEKHIWECDAAIAAGMSYRLSAKLEEMKVKVIIIPKTTIKIAVEIFLNSFK